jgi:hypothetical protein
MESSWNQLGIFDAHLPKLLFRLLGMSVGDEELGCTCRGLILRILSVH